MSTTQLVFYFVGILAACVAIGFVVGYIGFGLINRRDR